MASKSLKLTLLAHSFPPVTGGGETLIYLLAKYLSRKGYIISVVTGQIPRNFKKSELLYDGFKVFRIPSFEEFSRGEIGVKFFLEKAYQTIKKTSPDILHAFNFYPAYLGSIYSMHENIPLIFTYHNTPLGNGKVIKMFNDINIEQAFVQHIIREIKFCSLITQSKYFANNALHLGVSKNLIRCCYPGPDTETFFPEARNSNLRKKMGIDSKEILIVIPSRITPRKSIETIVEATNLLKKLPIKVVISSGGFIQPGFESYYEKILALIKQYHLSQQILLPKCQFNVTQLGELYASADIGVLSSTVEGLGLGILEMMQCGVPMVCSDTEGITEIITHKVNGILFPVGNPDQLAKSIELLVKKPSIRQKMGMEAKKLVEKKFKLSNYINFHDKIYKEVVKNNIL